LEIDGDLRVDLEGLDAWIADRPDVLGPDDRAGAVRLRQLAIHPDTETS